MKTGRMCALEVAFGAVVVVIAVVMLLTVIAASVWLANIEAPLGTPDPVAHIGNEADVYFDNYEYVEELISRPHDDEVREELVMRFVGPEEYAGFSAMIARDPDEVLHRMLVAEYGAEVVEAASRIRFESEADSFRDHMRYMGFAGATEEDYWEAVEDEIRERGLE